MVGGGLLSSDKQKDRKTDRLTEEKTKRWTARQTHRQTDVAQAHGAMQVGKEDCRTRINAKHQTVTKHNA